MSKEEVTVLKSECEEQIHNNKPCKIRVLPPNTKGTYAEEFLRIMNEFGVTSELLQDQMEWTYDYTSFHHEEKKEKIGLCLCGRKIKQVVYLLQKQTDLYFQICYDCLSNHIPWMFQLIDIDKQREQFTKMLKTKTKATASVELYRLCFACDEKKIHFSQHKNLVRCKECFIKFKPIDKKYYRPCIKCDRYVIPKTDPEYRQQCINCFIDNPTPYCVHCQGTGMALWSPELFRECSECFS